MRSNSTIVERFLADALKILIILHAIVGCTFSGAAYNMQLRKAAVASTMTSTTSGTAETTEALFREQTKLFGLLYETPTIKGELESASAAATKATHLPLTALATLRVTEAAKPIESKPTRTYSYADQREEGMGGAFSNADILPTSALTTANDADEIDGMDYIMTKHIAARATSTHLNKTQDLSSLSLLSLNETTASSPGPSESHKNRSAGHPAYSGKTFGNSNITLASYQHIGSQRIALKSTMVTTTARPSATSAATNVTGHTTKSNTRTSAKKVESKYILPKPQKTDAPMLNYIFDTFSSANKHHHHDQRYGPHFEDVQRVGQPTNMTVQAGSSVHLNCRISLLQDKTVSWVRRNAQGEDALDLLTVGLHTYTGDKRYKMEFQYPNNWRLKITNVKKDDEAMYECQISTHPPRVIQINLHVNAPKVMIVDEFGDPLQEKYYEIDSTLQLSCVVRNVAMATSVVYWKHGEDVLNYDVTRGGVSVKTELKDDGANSTLFIAKINKADSGNYTCSISDFQNFTIVVHILNGESFAELHHGGSAQLAFHPNLVIKLILSILLLRCLPAYIHR